ncbi:MAG: hypothetical protein RIT04_424 [Candidatus Parcubacteria bacterium]|jgi:hypothetical protein
MEQTQTTSPHELKSFITIAREAYRLCKANIHALALLSAIPFVFVGGVQAIASVVDTYQNSSTTYLATFGIIALIFGVISFILRVAYPLVIVRTIDSIHNAPSIQTSAGATEGVDVSVMPATIPAVDPHALYMKSIKEFFPYFWVVLLSGCVLGASALFFVIPAFFVFAYFSFSTFTYLFEGKRGIQSLVASAWIVRGRVYEALNRFLSVGISLMFLGLILSIVLHIITTIALGSFDFNGVVADFILSLIITLFIMPYAYTCWYLLYRDFSVGVSAEIDPVFAKKAKYWAVFFSIIAGIALIAIPTVLIAAIASGQIYFTF